MSAGVTPELLAGLWQERRPSGPRPSLTRSGARTPTDGVPFDSVPDSRRYPESQVRYAIVTGLPDHDFWLFDDRDAYRMHYTPEGAFIGGELLPAERLGEYRGYRDRGLAKAVSFADYWERHH